MVFRSSQASPSQFETLRHSAAVKEVASKRADRLLAMDLHFKVELATVRSILQSSDDRQ